MKPLFTKTIFGSKTPSRNEDRVIIRESSAKTEVKLPWYKRAWNKAKSFFKGVKEFCREVAPVIVIVLPFVGIFFPETVSKFLKANKKFA
jgi:hypothetical protein